MMILYNVLLSVGVVLALPLLISLVLATDKRRKTVLKRLGLGTLSQHKRQARSAEAKEKPVWVHALSVGEVLSAVPLVKSLGCAFCGKNIVFSSSTKTGFEIARKRLINDVDAVFFFPYDLPFSVRAALERIDPAAVIIVETDLWPNFLWEMKKRRVPAVLVNARLSRRSYLGYKRISFFMKPLLLTFSTICTQTEEDARRFERLGFPANRIAHTGNLKFDQEYETISEGELVALRQSMQIKPWQGVLLAGSTHKGEEEILLDVFSRLKGEFPDLLLIIAPRDPKRSLSVCRMFRAAGFAAHLLTDLPSVEPDAKSDLIVVDVIGILRRLYALADVAFVGGSLVNSGGQNPLEPAIFSKPVLFGPHMSNFQEISRMLLVAGGAVEVRNAEGLYHTTAALLNDRSRSESMGRHACNVLYTNKGVVEKTVSEIENTLNY